MYDSKTTLQMSSCFWDVSL